MPNERYGIYDVGTDQLLNFTVDSTLRGVDPEKRCSLINKILAESSAISVLTKFIAFCDYSDEKWPSDALFKEECYDKLKKLAIEQINLQAQSGRLREVKDLGDVVYWWREWTDDEKPVIEFIEDMVSTPEGALDFIAGCLTLYQAQGMNDYVPHQSWKLKLELLTDLMDLDELKTLLSKLTDEQIVSLSEHRRMGLQAFNSATEQRTDSH